MSPKNGSARTVAAESGAEGKNQNEYGANDSTTEEIDNDPDWLEPKFDNIPDALKAQPWAVWIAEPRLGKPGKFDKAPRCPKGGYKIGTNQPEKFGTLAEAKAAYERGGYTGVGVLLTRSGIIGVDIDDYSDTFLATPKLQKWTAKAVSDGAYCEFSPSGEGLRLFMYGKLPESGRKVGPLEIYDNVRFLTVTGHAVDLKQGDE